jgi:hypothetical protein
MDEPSSVPPDDRLAVRPTVSPHAADDVTVSSAKSAIIPGIGARISDARLPLVIGVTGHRDLRPAAHAELASCVRTILLDLRTAYPNTPLLLLSPLAEGADRLVAEVALEPAIAASLMVPMPMPRTLYERDFQTAESRAEFARLLASASHTLELPLTPGVTGENVRDINQRQLQYLAVGEFVARHCQILIALWDGQSGAAGGTAEVVQLKLTGTWPGSAADAPFDGLVPVGPVYHVATPRERHEAYVPQVTFTELYPQRDEDETGDFYRFRVLKPLDDYNREVTDTPDAAAVAGRAAADLIPDLENAALLNVRGGLEVMRQHYAIADVLAGRYHAKTVSALFWVSLVVFFAALAFDSALHLLVGESLETVSAISMFSSPLLMLAAVLVYRRAKRNDYQNKFQDYRGLAEALRIQFFWRLAGLNDCVADHYLGRHRWELEWIRNACRSSLVAANCPLGPVSEDTRKLVQDCWIAPQQTYLSHAIVRQEHKLEKFERIIGICFWAGLAAIFGLSLLIAIHVQHASDLLAAIVGEKSRLHGVLLTMITMSAVVAALVHNYVEKLAFRPQTRMYEGMVHIYRRYGDRLRSASAAVYLSVVFRLGQEALMENGDWIMTHRERPLDVPHH